MSQNSIGNRLAGYGNNGVGAAPSLYKTVQRPASSQGGAYGPPSSGPQASSSLQKLYANQPRDNSISFTRAQQPRHAAPPAVTRVQAGGQQPFNPLNQPGSRGGNKAVPHGTSPLPHQLWAPKSSQSNPHTPSTFSPQNQYMNPHSQKPQSDLYTTNPQGNMYYNSKLDRTTTQSAIDLAEKAKIEALKQLRITKQFVGERYGSASKTIDQEVNDKMQTMTYRRDRYQKLQTAAEAMWKDYNKFCKSQLAFGECLREIGAMTPEISETLITVGETQSRVANTAQPMLLSLSRFSSGIQTLVEKTMQDSLQSASRLNTTRLEYDGLRQELDQQRVRHMGANPELQHKFHTCQELYARQREELLVKLQLLDENRVRVLKDNSENIDMATTQHIMACHEVIDPLERAKTEQARQAQMEDFTPQFLSGDTYDAGVAQASDSMTSMNLNSEPMSAGANSTHNGSGTPEIPNMEQQGVNPDLVLHESTL